jgi:hypothetical protein
MLEGMVFPEHARKDHKRNQKQEEKMKKFWIVLLSLGLIMAFSMPVFAMDVKFYGEYKVQGIYQDNTALVDKSPAGASSTGASLTWQRLRIGTIFQVAEGLKLTTQFDALEKVWGAQRTAYGAAGAGSTYFYNTSGYSSYQNTDAQNIQFQQAYVTFNVPFGVFDVGYQTQSRFGTAFADNGQRDNGGPRVKYTFATGPLTFLAIWDKFEGNKNIIGQAGALENDLEKWSIAGIFKWSTGEGGVLLQYIDNSANSDPVAVAPAGAAYTGSRQKLYLIDPYFKATFGPVYVEAEVAYVFGKVAQYVIAGKNDIDMSSYGGYVMANVNLAPFYVGGAAVYASGDDKTDLTKAKGFPGSGADFNPCLIMLNYDLGRIAGSADALVGGNSAGASNFRAFQLFAGVKPMPKLDIKASITNVAFNEDPRAGTTTAGVPSKDIGNELDLTATYKIYDNLSYMVGAAYLWAGDYWKFNLVAGNNSAKSANDYLLTHMLTLSF